MSRYRSAMRRLLLLLILLCAAPASAAVVGGLTIDGARVTIVLDDAVPPPKGFALEAPRRLVVDLAGVSSPRVTVDGRAPVTRARIGQFDTHTARLVIDLAEPMRVRSSTQGGDHRLILELAPVGAGQFKRAVSRGRTTLPGFGPALVTDFDLPDDVFGGVPAPVQHHAGRQPLVVIDAGHGGKDVGAISSLGGQYEKDATLAIVREAARALRATGAVRVKLTRDDDRFIPLNGRVAIARAAKADLFVSVHADSAPNAGARGASVYTLSATASDAVAARLAARENKADIIAGVDIAREAPEVGDILIDLEQRQTMNVAVAFAETLQDELASRIGFRGEFHHFAGFLVLKAADIPSVLLETGYVTNDDDAKLLFSEAGQRRIGEGIARAIEAHLLRSGGKPVRARVAPSAAAAIDRAE